MDAMSSGSPTWREQQRQATLDEIVRTARAQLVESREVSLRSVAQAMGLTPPALYRYVESADDLTLRVAAQVYDELLAHLQATAAPYAPDEAGQLVAASTAFRQWALAHPAEFSLTFTNPLTGIADVHAAGARFRDYVAQLVRAVWSEHGEVGDTSTPPESPTIPSSLRETSDEAAPAGAAWAYVRCWSRLYGTTTLEVFGHVDPALVRSGALFLDTMTQCSAYLGLESRRDELVAIVRQTLDSSAG